MNWVVLSALVPIFIGLTNIVDDFMVRKPFAHQTFLYVFSGAVCFLIPAALIFLFHAEAREVSVLPAVMMIAVGAVIMTGFISFYIFSLQRSGPEAVVPLFQTIPAFVFLGGYLFLGETISFTKLAACLVIMAAAIAITWDFTHKKVNAFSLVMMTASSMGVAAYTLLARYFTESYDPYTILAHVWMGFGCVALVMLLSVGQWRRGLREIVSASPCVALGGLAAQAVLMTFGELCLVRALQIAPAAGLVQTLSGMQPAYVLGFMTLLGFIAPSHYKKLLMDRMLVWRIICIIILFAGVSVISLSGD